MRKQLILGLTLILALATSYLPIGRSSFTTAGSSTSTLTEWSVPTSLSGPWALTLDPSGRCCWFLEYYGNKVAHLNPINNTFEEWVIPTAQSNPYGLATTMIHGSLVVWGTEMGTDRVFAFSPSSGLFREYALSKYGTGELGVAGISVEPTSEQVWITQTLTNFNDELIYDPVSGNVTMYQSAFPLAVGGGANGVYAGSGSIWFAGFSALVRWDKNNNQYSIWPLPVHGSAVGRYVTLDQYGQAWYTQGVTGGTGANNFVGVLRNNNTLQEWQIPNSGSDPRGISIDPLTQQPWIAEQSSQVNNGTVASLEISNSSSTTSIQSITISSSSGTPTILASSQNHVTGSVHVVTPSSRSIIGLVNTQFTDYLLGQTLPHEAVVDSSGNIWISEPGMNKIARLSLSPDFVLQVSPPALSLSQGGTSIVTVTGVAISGYIGQVALGLEGIPRGVTASSFDPIMLSLQSGGTSSSQLSLTIAADAPNGTDMITIKGTSDNITHRISLVLTITNSTSSFSSARCLIATATFGSELSPEVQLLRTFRDNSLAKSKLGSSFLILFNAWYYSFSPFVANYLSSHTFPRMLMRSILYPFIGFLFSASTLFAQLSAYPEFATAMSGLLASFLIGAFYAGLPLGLLARRFRFRIGTKISVTILLGCLAVILLGEVLASSVLLMIVSGATVLAAMMASALLTAAFIAGKTNETQTRTENML